MGATTVEVFSASAGKGKSLIALKKGFSALKEGADLVCLFTQELMVSDITERVERLKRDGILTQEEVDASRLKFNVYLIQDDFSPDVLIEQIERSVAEGSALNKMQIIVDGCFKLHEKSVYEKALGAYLQQGLKLFVTFQTPATLTN